MINVLVTGSEGQLGSELKVLSKNYSDFLFFFTSKSELDIADHNGVDGFLVEKNIEVIVNCAAYTKVDHAESQPQLANEINHLAVENLADISKKRRIKLIHISTDYVFGGDSSVPFDENAIMAPVGVYGKSKMLGEKALLKLNPANSVIIRTSWLYSSFGSNFVKTILRICSDKGHVSVVNDQIGSPTYAGDLALAILNIITQLKNEKVEIYHYSNLGKCSWYDFAREIVKLSGQKCEVIPISSKAFNSKVKRPNFSLLNTEKIQEVFKFAIPHWKISLENCILKING